MDTLQWVVGAIVTLSVGAVGVVIELLRRSLNNAVTRKTNAEAESQEIKNIRSVLEEVRLERATDRAKMERLENQVEKLEERERHNLVRSAVHEAWDKLTHKLVLLHYPDHEPPPPLGNVSELYASEQLFVQRLQEGKDG